MRHWKIRSLKVHLQVVTNHNPGVNKSASIPFVKKKHTGHNFLTLWSLVLKKEIEIFSVFGRKK